MLSGARVPQVRSEVEAARSGLHPRARFFAARSPVLRKDSRSRRKGLSISSVDCGAHDTIQGASGGGTAAIAFFGGNDIFWDDGATIGRQDLINLFNQSAG